MAKRTIYSDIYLNFGKHKGRQVIEVLAEDPGYFLWLREAGQAILAKDVNGVVEEWAEKNKGDAKKTIRSAHKVLDKSVALPSSQSPEVDQSSVSYMPPPEPTPRTQPENWGCW